VEGGRDFASPGVATFVFAAVSDGRAVEVTGGEVTGTADVTTAEVDDLFEVALYPNPFNGASLEGHYVEEFAGLIHHTTL
jgi:hypothetical protein